MPNEDETRQGEVEEEVEGEGVKERIGEVESKDPKWADAIRRKREKDRMMDQAAEHVCDGFNRSVSSFQRFFILFDVFLVFLSLVS